MCLIPEKALSELVGFALTTSESLLWSCCSSPTKHNICPHPHPPAEILANILLFQTLHPKPNKSDGSHTHTLTEICLTPRRLQPRNASGREIMRSRCRRSFKVGRFVLLFPGSGDGSRPLPLPGCQGGFGGLGKRRQRPPVAILSTVVESASGWTDHESVLCLQTRVRAELPPTLPVRAAASRDGAQARKNPEACLGSREEVLVPGTTSVTYRNQNNWSHVQAVHVWTENFLKKKKKKVDSFPSPSVLLKPLIRSVLTVSA